MDATIKEQWISALRSGKYKQGRYALNINNKEFCCLGVLCDIIGLEWEDAYEEDPDIHLFLKKYNEECVLPNEVLKKVKMPRDTMDKLVKFNDLEGKTFSEIADYIEEYL